MPYIEPELIFLKVREKFGQYYYKNRGYGPIVPFTNKE
jgi:hypothetical protein